jgi:hypothetical protein
MRLGGSPRAPSMCSRAGRSGLPRNAGMHGGGIDRGASQWHRRTRCDGRGAGGASAGQCDRGAAVPHQLFVAVNGAGDALVTGPDHGRAVVTDSADQAIRAKHMVPFLRFLAACSGARARQGLSSPSRRWRSRGHAWGACVAGSRRAVSGPRVRTWHRPRIRSRRPGGGVGSPARISTYNARQDRRASRYEPSHYR